jgi:hypothetical protein
MFGRSRGTFFPICISSGPSAVQEKRPSPFIALQCCPCHGSLFLRSFLPYGSAFLPCAPFVLSSVASSCHIINIWQDGCSSLVLQQRPGSPWPFAVPCEFYKFCQFPQKYSLRFLTFLILNLPMINLGTINYFMILNLLVHGHDIALHFFFS